MQRGLARDLLDDFASRKPADGGGGDNYSFAPAIKSRAK